MVLIRYVRTRPIDGSAMPHFPGIFLYLKYLIFLDLLHGNKPNPKDRLRITQKSFGEIFVHIEFKRALLLYVFLEFSGIFDFIYL